MVGSQPSQATSRYLLPKAQLAPKSRPLPSKTSMPGRRIRMLRHEALAHFVRGAPAIVAVGRVLSPGVYIY